MIEKQLHIVSFNIPYPPNYGGVIDVYYKLKALSKLGIKIHLHCFQYGREASDKLLDYCESVVYYPRNMSLTGIFKPLPIIVSSRNHKKLLANLSKNEFPILFEGLHSTYFIDDPKLNNRLKIVRMHNIEWQYYLHLSKLEVKWYKTFYFRTECKRLRQYESILEHASKIICISPADTEYYFKKFPGKTSFISAFHENETVKSQLGKGDYVLYHGDLSVKDNEASALFLIEEVFGLIDIKFVIAGLNPGNTLVSEVEKHQNISLKSNLGFKEMQELIAKAHVNLLFSFQSAGMKLKLLNALYRGRHCIVNDKMVEKSEMRTLCTIKNTGPEIIEALISKMAQPFSEKERQKRVSILIREFSNEQNAKKLYGLF